MNHIENPNLANTAGSNVAMIRHALADVVALPLPPGHTLRGMQSAADIAAWTHIQGESDPWNRVTDSLFREQYGSNDILIAQRCLLLWDRDTPIGTIGAWFNPSYQGADAGRIHWVAIRPAWQGRGLAKPMLSAALAVLARHHSRAYLHTQSERLPAIRLYAQFGFQPHCTKPADTQIWAHIIEKLGPAWPHSPN
ncbi:MAG: GNAT family N-acetyltransferase, partial [Planctomycetota bacterium]|nr:GNAT family N-acetyltransferase [Planctomycetota bacterium]